MWQFHTTEVQEFWWTDEDSRPGGSHPRKLKIRRRKPGKTRKNPGGEIRGNLEENLRNIVFRRGTELINICSAEKPFSWPAALAEETTTFDGKMKNDEFLANLPNCQKFLNGETNLFQNIENSEREAQVKENVLLRAKLFRKSSSGSDRLYGKFLTAVAEPNMNDKELNEPIAGPSNNEENICSDFIAQMKKMGHSMESIVNTLLNKKPVNNENKGYTLVTNKGKRAKIDTANPVQLQNRFEAMGDMDTTEPQEGTPGQPALLRANLETQGETSEQPALLRANMETQKGTSGQPALIRANGNVAQKQGQINLRRSRPVPPAAVPTQATPNPKIKKIRIPPIYAYDLDSRVLEQITKQHTSPVKYEIRMGVRNSQTIFCKDEGSYKFISQIIDNSNAGGHTHCLPNEKRETRVLKGMPYEFGHEAVAAEIENKSGKKVSVKPMQTSKARKGGYQLNLYIVSGDKESMKEVVKLVGLFNHRVNWENLKKNTITMCSNCLRYGHSAAFCFNTPRCIKCEEMHNSWDCKKPKKDEPGATPAFCVNCQDFGHPASFGKCPVRLKLLEEIAEKKAIKKQKKDERIFNQSFFPMIPGQQLPHLPSQPIQPMGPNGPMPLFSQVTRDPPQKQRKNQSRNTENPMDYLEKECRDLFKFDMIRMLNMVNDFLPIYERQSSKAEKQKMMLNLFTSVCRAD